MKIRDLTSMKLLNTYLISKEISNESYVLNYFTHHLNRCIKVSDRIKLTAIICAKIVFISELVRLINEDTEYILNCEINNALKKDGFKR